MKSKIRHSLTVPAYRLKEIRIVDCNQIAINHITALKRAHPIPEGVLASAL